MQRSNTLPCHGPNGLAPPVPQRPAFPCSNASTLPRPLPLLWAAQRFTVGRLLVPRLLEPPSSPCGDGRSVGDRGQQRRTAPPGQASTGRDGPRRSRVLTAFGVALPVLQLLELRATPLAGLAALSPEETLAGASRPIPRPPLCSPGCRGGGGSGGVPRLSLRVEPFVSQSFRGPQEAGAGRWGGVEEICEIYRLRPRVQVLARVPRLGIALLLVGGVGLLPSTVGDSTARFEVVVAHVLLRHHRYAPGPCPSPRCVVPHSHQTPQGPPGTPPLALPPTPILESPGVRWVPFGTAHGLRYPSQDIAPALPNPLVSAKGPFLGEGGPRGVGRQGGAPEVRRNMGPVP